AWEAPVVAWARVNNDVVPLGPADAVPAATYLAPPAPNPAGDRAAIVLGVGGRDDGARAQVIVLDLAGRLVRTLVDGPLPAGTHRLTWDLRDAGGRAVPAGVYLVRAEAGRFSAVHRLVVVR
ncbi:MAG TPA: FlgD immunoglobulin-like domain containing protein, partial [Candidatus Eisenbacteria bacterium]